jgi:drug/metabolite transporter (DMT)-like permease
MSTKLWAIGLVVFSTILISAAQVMYKFAADDLSFSFSILTNWYIYIGLALYAISFLALIIALKHGELSVLHPIIALSYFWVSIFSVYIFGEIIGVQRWLGVTIVVLGVIFIGLGGKT